MIILYGLLILAAGIAGAYSCRECGKGGAVIGRPYAQIIYAAPSAVLGGAWWGSLLSVVGSFLGKTWGHGQYMGVPQEHGDPAGDEWYDFIVSWFFGPDDKPQPARYWRNVFGLALSGLFYSIVGSIMLAAHGNWLSSLVFLLGGAMKAPAYMISYALGKGTLWGEYLTGFFGWSSVAISAILMA